MNIFQAVLLGTIQGLTEFLPVSSSGHLVLGQEVLGINPPGLTFDVMLHFGTLVAVIAALWDEIKVVFHAFFALTSRITGKTAKSGGKGKGCGSADEGWSLLKAMVIATIPIGFAGVLFNDFVAGLFDSPKTVGAMLLLTGTILLVADRWPKGTKKLGQLRSMDALFVGLWQILALLPGVSRSGATISAGLVRGLERRSAARFSFLISLPAVLGATILEIPDVLQGSPDLPPGCMITGTLCAAVSGYIAIKFLLNIIQSRGLIAFAVYTWVVGIVVLLS